MCVHICTSLSVQVLPLLVARSTSAPFSYPVELTWGSPSICLLVTASVLQQVINASPLQFPGVLVRKEDRGLQKASTERSETS